MARSTRSSPAKTAPPAKREAGSHASTPAKTVSTPAERLHNLVQHRFRDLDLLHTALTHSSRSHELGAQPAPGARPVHNEQLEFLGDAVLSLVVAEALFELLPEAQEGTLTRLRASLVSREHLVTVAGRISLGEHLRLGRGEEHSGGRRKPALLADALEAVIAALYLDGGFTVAAEFIRREVVSPSLPALQTALTAGSTIGDYKTALQEILQSERKQQPRYVLTDESGPDHRRSFRIAVEVEGRDGGREVLAEAEGPTKKRAQQDAARLAVETLRARSAAQPHSGGTTS